MLVVYERFKIELFTRNKFRDVFPIRSALEFDEGLPIMLVAIEPRQCELEEQQRPPMAALQKIDEFLSNTHSILHMPDWDQKLQHPMDEADLDRLQARVVHLAMDHQDRGIFVGVSSMKDTLSRWPELARAGRDPRLVRVSYEVVE